jgi:hypothetical protein
MPSPPVGLRGSFLWKCRFRHIVPIPFGQNRHKASDYLKTHLSQMDGMELVTEQVLLPCRISVAAHSD